MTLLDACGVVAGYGETEILHGVSITVGMGEVVTIIGPNGCGKSTLKTLRKWWSLGEDITMGKDPTVRWGTCPRGSSPYWLQ